MTNNDFGGAEPAPVRVMADFGAALDVFKVLMGLLLPSGLLGAMALMSGAALVASAPMWVGRYLSARSALQVLEGQYSAAGQYELLSAALQVVSAALMLVVMAARLGLARPMRMVVLDGPTTVTGTGDALRLALGGFGPNLGICVVYALAISAGSCLCFIPGIVAGVLLYPALYLVATGREVGGSLSLSVDWVSRHTGALLGTIGVLFAVGLILGCCNCCLGGFLAGEGVGSGPAPMTLVYLLPAGTVLGELLSIVTLPFLASGCIAADQVESAPGGAPTGPF